MIGEAVRLDKLVADMTPFKGPFQIADTTNAAVVFSAGGDERRRRTPDQIDPLEANISIPVEMPGGDEPDLVRP